MIPWMAQIRAVMVEQHCYSNSSFTAEDEHNDE